jgi:hypothetical protein
MNVTRALALPTRQPHDIDEELTHPRDTHEEKGGQCSRVPAAASTLGRLKAVTGTVVAPRLE